MRGEQVKTRGPQRNGRGLLVCSAAACATRSCYMGALISSPNLPLFTKSTDANIGGSRIAIWQVAEQHLRQGPLCGDRVLALLGDYFKRFHRELRLLCRYRQPLSHCAAVLCCKTTCPPTRNIDWETRRLIARAPQADALTGGPSGKRRLTSLTCRSQKTSTTSGSAALRCHSSRWKSPCRHRDASEAGGARLLISLVLSSLPWLTPSIPPQSTFSYLVSQFSVASGRGSAADPPNCP